MSNYEKSIKKLNITINLNGNVKGSINYIYNTNTNPQSQNRSIYFTTDYLITPESLNRSGLRVDKKSIFLNINTFKKFLFQISEYKKDKIKQDPRFIDKKLIDELKEIQDELELLKEYKEYKGLPKKPRWNFLSKEIKRTKQKKIVEDLQYKIKKNNIDIKTANKFDKIKLIQERSKSQGKLDNAQRELKKLEKETKLAKSKLNESKKLYPDWSTSSKNINVDNEIKTLQKRKEEINKEIDTALDNYIFQQNLEIILPLFFKVNSTFYVKGKRFIIKKKYVLLDKKTNNLTKESQNALNYSRLKTEYLNKYLQSKIAELTDRMELLEKESNLFKNDKTFYREFDKDKLLTMQRYGESDKDFAKRKKDRIAFIAERKLMEYSRFKDFINKKIRELENQPYNKYNNIKYKYIHHTGIRIVDDVITDNKTIVIELFLIDGINTKNKHTRYNCATKKKHIYKTFLDLLGKKYNKKHFEVPAQHVNFMSNPLYSKHGYITNKTKKSYTDNTRSDTRDDTRDDIRDDRRYYRRYDTDKTRKYRYST